MANLATLRDQVRKLADVDATDVSDAEINTYINDSYQEALGDELWAFLLARISFPTVAGTSEYLVSSLASDIEAHRVVQVHAAGYLLDQIQPSKYFEMQPVGAAVSTSGTPNYWTILDGTTLVLWPQPSAVFTVGVVYYRVPADLTQDTDTPVFPSRYHFLLKWGALAYLYRKIGDLESADGAGKSFDDGTADLQADLVKSNPSEPLIWGDSPSPTMGLPSRLRYPFE